MGPGTEVSPQTILTEGGGCCKGNVGAAMEDVNDETLDHPNQSSTGKPPRSLSVMRHCISSARLTGGADWVSNVFHLHNPLAISSPPPPPRPPALSNSSKISLFIFWASQTIIKFVGKQDH